MRGTRHASGRHARGCSPHPDPGGSARRPLSPPAQSRPQLEKRRAHAEKVFIANEKRDKESLAKLKQETKVNEVTVLRSARHVSCACSSSECAERLGPSSLEPHRQLARILAEWQSESVASPSSPLLPSLHLAS
eukprot:748550-Hanusia_phi.AAC.3